jgi:hypothetical protein
VLDASNTQHKKIITTSNEQQATSNQQPAARNQQPATSNQQQATSNKQQATSNKQQATSNKLQITNYKLQTTSKKQEARSNKQQTTSNKLQATNNNMRTCGIGFGWTADTCTFSHIIRYCPQSMKLTHKTRKVDKSLEFHLGIPNDSCRYVSILGNLD